MVGEVLLKHWNFSIQAFCSMFRYVIYFQGKVDYIYVPKYFSGSSLGSYYLNSL